MVPHRLQGTDPRCFAVLTPERPFGRAMGIERTKEAQVAGCTVDILN